ncbi:HAD hydrolase-like protein [Clostridium sp. SHJSY1]|nr:HAD hydrolase-like protein [Clostridium sp. SHJSY1]
MIKMVAFDFDGTIADTIPMCIEAFKKVISPYAGHELTEHEILQTFGLNEIGMVKTFVKINYKL